MTAVNIKDPAAWQMSTTMDTPIKIWYTTNNVEERKNQSESLKHFFIGRGITPVISGVIEEMYRCHKEYGITVTKNYNLMTPIVASHHDESGLITTQPTRTLTAAPTHTTMTFEEAKPSLAFAFLDLINDYENAALPEASKPTAQISRLLRDFPVSVINIDELITLIAQAVCRYCYEEIAINDPRVQEAAPQYNGSVDRYFWCCKCAAGGSVFPGVLLTVPQVADFLKSLPLTAQASLPGLFLTLGLLLNETVCMRGLWGCCKYCGNAAGCGCRQCESCGCCQGANKPQDFTILTAPTRKHQQVVKNQWVMLSVGCFGTTAQVLAPLLREKYLVGVMASAKAAAVTSLPVLIGVNLVAAGVAYIIISNLQAKGRVKYSPATTAAHLASECFASLASCFGCGISHRAGYAVIGDD